MDEFDESDEFKNFNEEETRIARILEAAAKRAKEINETFGKFLRLSNSFDPNMSEEERNEILIKNNCKL